MTDTELLYEKIKQSGLKICFIAWKLGLSRQGFYNKVNNKSEFNAKEIQLLYSLLGLTEKERIKIFFAKNVGKKSTIEEKKEES